MNYIGSKHSLLPFLESVFREVADGDEAVFCDLFAGTGAVGRHFKRLGMRVIANDLQYYAYVLNRAYIGLNAPPTFERLRGLYARELGGYPSLLGDPVEEVLAFLSDLSPQRGFLSSSYAPAGGRCYYTDENAGKADAIRTSIESWRRDGILSEEEYFYVLCCLVEAVDKVANTASVYGAYLKEFKKTALKPLRLKPLALCNHVAGSQVFHCDANELVTRVECDVLYLDPPYNERQYGANYHVLETVARYDHPKLRGKTGMRHYPRSRFCQRTAIREALEHLVRSARARHILMSYNDEGLITLEEVHEVLSLRGTPRTFTRPYSRYKADNGRDYKRDSTLEYVHYVRVEPRSSGAGPAVPTAPQAA